MNSPLAPFHDTENSAQCWLEHEDGTLLPLSGNCSIGRTPENSICVDDSNVSRRHAVILTREDRKYWLIDFSKNGTFVNTRRITAPQRLRNGDDVRISTTHFVFRSEYPTGPIGPQTTNRDETTTSRTSSERVWIMVGDLEKFGVLCQQLSSEEIPTVIGSWLKDCTKVVEKSHGAINNYLGDAFLACWRQPEDAIANVTAAIEDFRVVRAASAVRFRIIVHIGEVFFGGAPSMGESMLGSAVNLTFRMEKVAADLNVDFCFTEEAYSLLHGKLLLSPLPGEFSLKGFRNKYKAYTLQ